MKFTLLSMLHLMNFLIISSLIFCTLAIPSLKNNEGTFWHVTDIHVDQNYSRTGNPDDLCHISANYTTAEDNGIYGNIMCDSPQALVDFTVQSMKTINPKPDFILWTGDNLPHTRNPNPEWNVVLDQVKNITMQLSESFKGVPIYPSIGNHDTFPPNLLYPANHSNIYHDYFEKGGWKYILPNSTWDTFKNGGYYSHSLRSGLRIISLNTILWYQSNSLVENETDTFQFEFLKNELKSASGLHEKVYIIGHVSPGYYNRIRNKEPSTPLYHLPYMKEYLQIIKSYSDVIAGQFFGHIHNDMFQLYYCDTGEALSSGLLAGSVTPWHSNTHKNVNVSIPVNPSVRLMHFNPTNFLPLDYEQYYLNLTEANQIPLKIPEYKLLYRFTDTYNVRDLSTKSLLDVYERLKTNKTLFQTFFKYLTAGKETVRCDDVCQTAQLCSMAGTSENEYMLCMRLIDNDLVTDDDKNTHTVAYVVGFICLFAAIVAISLILYSKRKRWSRRNHQDLNSYSGI